MATTIMRSKDVHIALKKNNGIEYLMKKYGFSSAEELYDGIRKISPLGAEEMIRNLEKRNHKKENRKCKVETNLVEEIPCQENLKEAETCQESQVEKNFMAMEDLKKQEKALSEQVCNLEGMHKEMVSKRRAILEELRTAQDILKQLLTKLAEQRLRVTDIYRKYNECAEKMKQINQETNEYEEQLKNIRVKISELQKISILVYRNGNIEAEHGLLPNFSEKSAEESFSKLVKLPEAGEFTVNELKAIANLKEIVKCYENDGYTAFEIVFENDRIEVFWNIINKNN